MRVHGGVVVVVVKEVEGVGDGAPWVRSVAVRRVERGRICMYKKIRR